MTRDPRDPALLGYVDRLSARPGDTLAFKVSSASQNPFRAWLVRSISADPNPDGPGIVEQDAAAWFPSASFPSVDRPFAPGSCGIAQDRVAAEPTAEVMLSANVCPTLFDGRPQTVLGVGRYDLRIDGNGCVCLCIGDRTVKVRAPLTLRRWSRIEARVSHDAITVSHRPITGPITGRDGTGDSATGGGIGDLSLSGVPCVGARLRDGAATGHFDGKIEAPAIAVDGVPLCAWDFARDIPTATAPALVGSDLTLVNHPTRAVTGSAWEGSEMNWSHRPDHYAAIHFHHDDIYDFGWDTDFTLTLPADMPSGVYVMRIACDGHEDAIPFFVCAPRGRASAKLAVLVSTFTYAVYGNHARPDYRPSWQDRIRKWGAYPHNPAEHPRYGLSTYNYHADGSGICHASHLRPMFNLRPGYLTFGDATCSGLRHFPADMHLIAWLHAKDIPYDLITDRELHDEGVAAIAGYAAVTTGTHPEYHTARTLDALRDYRDGGGQLHYLGGNGFYWRIAIHSESPDMLEIRRAEDGIRAWAAEPGEYYNAFDGGYGGLWRRNGRPPQDLVGIGFTAQGEFFGDPYRRVSTDPAHDWVFEGVEGDLIGNFGYSGNGAAGFELDHMDPRLGTPQNTVLLAQSVTRDNGFMLVPEEQLTHLTNLTGGSAKDAMHADMILTEYPGGGSVFATGSITFCGCLPWNGYDNDVSTILANVLSRALK